MHLGDHGQPRVEHVLTDMFMRHRLAGSFLFDGPAGVGKEALAVELGRLLNCEREGSCEPRGLYRAPPTNATSAACSSCRRFLNLQHPDLHLVFPVPIGFWEKTGKSDAKLEGDWAQREPRSIIEVLRGKAHDPYWKPMFERPVGIHADVLRELVLPAVQRRPVEARTKVVILSDADQTAFGIGNVLLKTLEEPPPDCLLVLTSSSPERLLPTIRSRCQRLTFAPLANRWMQPRLQLLHSADAPQARLAASLSQGSMLLAGRFLSGVLTPVRERAFEVLRAATACDVLELLGLASATARGYAKQRPMFPLLLQMIVLVARDCLLLVEGAADFADENDAPGKETLQLVHADRAEELRGLAQTYSSEGLRRIIRQVEQAEREIAGYAHSELTLGSLFIGMARESERARALAGRR